MDKQRVFSIYSEALDVPLQSREALITERAAGDAELAAEVRSLLDAQADRTFPAQGSLDDLRNDYWRSVTGVEDAEEDLAGQRIGIWQLQTRIGRGGLATVYLAERADGAYSQTAAFKVLRRGLDTDDVIARFRVEREILASLEHPDIASILDGGALPDGRPFLVLEFVNGTDLVSYAEDQALAVVDRLHLIERVAEALNHAHQRLVVHRDIKPSNVMVTSSGEVRLLDFGIARILDPSSSPLASRLTRTGIQLLTPAYATPEQVRNLPVTTASDVYQLGLLMAEVLTGERPESGSGSGTAARPRLQKLATQDLRAIVEKATRLEPEARYGSVRELAEDIQRHRQNRPVLARAGSWRYRSGKLLKRRPLLVPGIAAVCLAVAGYVATITVYSQQLERERTIAERTQAFMIRLFESPNPSAPADPARGRAITVVEALDIGRDRLLAELATQPELDASLSRAIASVYAALDQFEPAIELRERSLALEEALYGADSALALAGMRALASLYAATGDMGRARSLTDRQLEIACNMDDPGPELGLAEHAAAEQFLREGEHEAGEALLERAITSLVEQKGVAQRVDGDALLALLESAAAADNPARQILAARKIAEDTLGADVPDVLIIRSRAASSLYQIGETVTAEAEYKRVIADMVRVLGDKHPDTLATRNNLALLYSGTGRYAEAERVQRELLQRSLDVFGPDSQAVATSYQNLATAVSRQGRYEEAIGLHEQAFATYARVFDADHFTTALPLISKAYAELLSEQPSTAEKSARAALDRIEAHGADLMLSGIARCLIGLAGIRQGDASGEALSAEARQALMGLPVPEPYAELCGLND